MNEREVSIERIRFTEYETGIETVLREYHRSVAKGHREFLSHRAEGDEFSPDMYVQGEIEKDRSYLQENTAEQPLVVAVDDATVVGCVYLYDLTGGAGEIKRLYVRDAYRSQGLGRRLMERVIEYAEHVGYDSLRLDTAPYMDSAQYLYRELGFTPYEGGESITDVPDPILDDLVFMKLNLNER